MNKKDLVAKTSELISQMDNDQINQIIAAINSTRDLNMRAKTNQLNVGDLVKLNMKSGKTVVGNIYKVNQKTVLVKTTLGEKWKVSSSLVSLVH
jgi:exosome complex RNA-binding protein Csl4